MSSPANRQRILKLVFWAFLCALPFLVVSIYLGRQVDKIDTLPADEYRDLVWTSDDKGLLFTHKALTEDSPAELWVADTNESEFTSLTQLSPDKSWHLTGQSVDDAAVLAATSKANGEELFLLEGSGLKAISVEKGWQVLPNQGAGLFFVESEQLEGEERMASMEDAPEVAPTPSAAPATPSTESTPTPSSGPSGLGIGRYDRQAEKVELLFSIPFRRPEEEPKIWMVRESPDRRFLALVVSFGPSGRSGLWVYDSEASRLLWTRIVLETEVYGLDWSSNSESLALTDKNGLVVLGNVMGVESTRYDLAGLGEVRPLFEKDDELCLIGASSLHRLDRQEGRADVLFDARAKQLDVQDFRVSSTGSKVAFFAATKGYLELQVVDVDSKGAAPQELNLPGSTRGLAQGTMGYQVGDALRSAWRFWTGSGG